MFGGSDKVMRVFRLSGKGKEQVGLAYQSQLDKLNQPKEGPTEPFALTGGEAREEQPRLFGPGDLGEILGPGGKKQLSGKPPNDDTFSLFHNDRGTFEPGKIKSYLDENLKDLRGARELERGIFDLDSQHQAQIIRAVQVMEKSNEENGGAEKALPDYEKILHHLENPNAEKLTPKQDAILDDKILPIMEQNEELYKELKDDAVPIENYVHREVKGKGGWFDRIASGIKGAGKGNLLSKSAPQTKGRTMMALEYVGQSDPQASLLHQPGDRKVISLKGGQVTAWKDGKPENLGGISHSEEGKVFEDKDGSIWHLTQATTKEIEANTDTRYYKNALASALVSNIQLSKAVRAQRFIEAFKASDDFKSIAQQGGTPPKGWRTTSLPQLSGYYFERHYADVLDRYAQQLQYTPNALDKVVDFLRASILLNPTAHPLNVAGSWVMDKGVTGFLPHNWAALGRAGTKAFKAMLEPELLAKALDAGAPLQSVRPATAKISSLFFDQLGESLVNNEPWALRLAKMAWFSPANLVTVLHNLSSKIAWAANDFLFLQAAYQREAQGMDLRTALRETGRTIPDYRLPTHILNSKSLGKMMGNRWATIFSSYHYGLWRGFIEAAKSATGINENPVGGEGARTKDVGHGWDKLVMAGLVSFVLFPMLLDEAARKTTGNPRARARRFGPYALIDAWQQVFEGKKAVNRAVQGTVTPAPQTKSAIELAANLEFYSGRQIYNPHDDWKTEGRQIMRYLVGQVGQVGQAERASESKSQWRRYLLGQAGIRMERTRAETVAADIAHSKYGSEAAEPGESEMYGLRHDILDALRDGDSKPMEEAEDKGQITPAQAKQLRHRATFTPLQDMVNGFSYDEAMRVRAAAEKDGNQDEIRQLDQVLSRKRRAMWARHESVPAAAQ